MPSPITNKLYGIQTIAPTTNGTFVFTYDKGTIPFTNSQVHILVDGSNYSGSGNITIILPSISSFNNFWSTSINVVDISNTATSNPITIVPSGGNLVNGDANTLLDNDGNTVTLMIASQGLWYSTTSGGGGGGGASVISVTYTQLQALVLAAALVPAALYIISEFNRNMPNGSPQNPNDALPNFLYDDGTNSGITIFMYALTTTQMATSGYGLFYNPKYTGSAEYNNVDGTGLYQIWDGDNPDPLQVPAYGVGDVVFWGGYAWQNNSGNVGNAIDVRTLSIDWSKITYSDKTWYAPAIDDIKVDWDNGVLVERKNASNNITVAWSPLYYYYEGYYNLNINPIALIPWGIYGDVTQGDDYGVADLSVIDSYVELVNFKGRICVGNNIISQSIINNNYFGKGLTFRINEINDGLIRINTFATFSEFSRNSIYNQSSVQGNSLTQSAIIQNNMMFGRIEDNTLTQGSIIRRNECIGESYIINNSLTGSSEINYNILNESSAISSNILASNSRITTNILKVEGFIQNNDCIQSVIVRNNLFNNSSISENNIEGFNISSNILDNNCQIAVNSAVGLNTLSSITNNILSNDSFINQNNLSFTECFISNNRLSNYSYINVNVFSDESRIVGNTINENSFITALAFLGINNAIESNTITGNSYFQSVSVSGASTISHNNLFSECYFRFCDVIDGSKMNRNNLSSKSFFEDNNLQQASQILDNTLSGLSNISSNILINNSLIEANTLENVSVVSSNELDASTLSYNNCDNNSLIQANICGSSAIINNTVENQSSVTNNVLEAASIDNNIFSNSSGLNLTTFSTRLFRLNTLTNAALDFSFGIVAGNISYNNFYNVTISADISAATLIYGAYTKNFYVRQDGLPRLTYINNANALVVALPTA